MAVIFKSEGAIQRIDGLSLSTSIKIAKDMKSTLEEIQNWLLILDVLCAAARPRYAKKRQKGQEDSDTLNDIRERALRLDSYDSFLKGSLDEHERLLAFRRRY